MKRRCGVRNRAVQTAAAAAAAVASGILTAAVALALDNRHAKYASSCADLVPYREHEQGVLGKGQGGDKQQQRVRQLFHRQLLVPLQDGEDTMAKYQAWEAGVAGSAQPAAVPTHVQKGYNAAQKAVQLRQEYEVAVSPEKGADAAVLEGYMAYIKFEQVSGYNDVPSQYSRRHDLLDINCTSVGKMWSGWQLSGAEGLRQRLRK